MSLVHTLKQLADKHTILIVDDNKNLQQQLKEFLDRFFSQVYVASNGAEGYELFKEKRPYLVITDIQMPEVNGLDMVKKIRLVDFDMPIIVMSAYDEKEYLLESIRLGIINYLKKPAKINALCEVIIETLERLKLQDEKELLNRYTNDTFTQQDSLILLFERNQPVIANPAFLEFFKVDTLKEFKDEYIDLGLHFQKQDEFLYNTDEDWFSKVSRQSGSFFHTKISDKEFNHFHFLLKYINISERAGYGLLTLDDITELNLMALFSVEDIEGEGNLFGDEYSINNALTLLTSKSIDVKVYNFYKGLSITNPAKILSFDDGVIELEVNDNQLMASAYEKSIIIGSDALPHFIWCNEIISFDQEMFRIKATDLKFMKSNPTKRRNIRLVPEDDYKISLFFKLKEFLGDVSIIDISVDGMKLNINSLLVGMKDDEKIELSMTLARQSDNVSLDISSRIMRIDKIESSYHVILEFNLDEFTKKQLTDYISKRQIQLIREFKELKI